MPDGTYAPQSPDLSSFLSSASPKKKPPTSSYTPKSPNLLGFATSQHQPHQQQHQRQHENSGLGIGYQAPALQQYHHQSYNAAPPFDASLAPAHYGGGQYHHQSYLPPIPDLPPSHAFPTAQQQQQQQQQPGPFPTHQSPFRPDLAADAAQLGYPAPPPSIPDPADMSARSKRGAAMLQSENGAAAGSSDDLGPSQGIDIRTKFPVARIKRIMQADEEVGKVAQVTPVAVSKALELFMIELVTKSATLAKASNSKRVTAQHLKKAIEGDVQYDFLSEIVSRVAEGPDAGGKRVKSEDGSDDQDMDKPGKGAKKAKGRRKKGE